MGKPITVEKAIGELGFYPLTKQQETKLNKAMNAFRKLCDEYGMDAIFMTVNETAFGLISKTNRPGWSNGKAFCRMLQNSMDIFEAEEKRKKRRKKHGKARHHR